MASRLPSRGSWTGTSLPILQTVTGRSVPAMRRGWHVHRRRSECPCERHSTPVPRCSHHDCPVVALEGHVSFTLSPSPTLAQRVVISCTVRPLASSPMSPSSHFFPISSSTS
nr:hypothetical protein CFP56_29903 [Quercus suber]